MPAGTSSPPRPWLVRRHDGSTVTVTGRLPKVLADGVLFIGAGFDGPDTPTLFAPGFWSEVGPAPSQAERGSHTPSRSR